MAKSLLFIILFLHQTTTDDYLHREDLKLFIILFLHQTTTLWLAVDAPPLLFIILFLHQTTTHHLFTFFNVSCLSSCSYIKPQRNLHFVTFCPVVYHLVPTSNHNGQTSCDQVVEVVYHLVPTSNHNFRTDNPLSYWVVYHLVPTSNHNYRLLSTQLSQVVYHLVPTSNHNTPIPSESGMVLFIILFLHQTTTLSISY